MPRIWGARSLASIYSDKTNLPEPIGEAWLTGPDSKIETGPLEGPLHQAWQKMPPEWRGTDFASPEAPREFHSWWNFFSPPISFPSRSILTTPTPSKTKHPARWEKQKCGTLSPPIRAPHCCSAWSPKQIEKHFSQL